MKNLNNTLSEKKGLNAVTGAVSLSKGTALYLIYP